MSDKHCAVPGCGAKYYCRGYCKMHHCRWKRHGDPLVCLKRPNGTGGIDNKGYLKVRIGKERHFVHRLVLREKLGSRIYQKCNWCGCRVSWNRTWPKHSDALVVNHLDHNPLNNSPDNLVPSCGACNVTHLRRKNGSGTPSMPGV